MRLADFLVSAGTEKNLAELILFLGKQALVVKKGFLGTSGKITCRRKDPERIRRRADAA